MIEPKTMPQLSDPAAVQAVVDAILGVYGRWGPGTGIAQMRQDFEAFHAPAPDLPQPRPVSAGAVPAVWLGPPASVGQGMILYLHGGGFQMGSTDTHRGLMAGIAAASRRPVLGLDYRLAPEHRHPAPLEDALAAWDWLLAAGHAPETIALAGDSAGGGLAVSLMLALKARGAALPAAAALMSPWTDMAAAGESYRSRAAADPIHQRPMLQALARTFLGKGGDARDPLASPLHGDLAGLPPLLVQAGDRETVLDDSVALAGRAAAAGVTTELQVWDGMIHVFQMFPGQLAEARQAVDAIGLFLAVHLPGGPAGGVSSGGQTRT